MTPLPPATVTFRQVWPFRWIYPLIINSVLMDLFDQLLPLPPCRIQTRKLITASRRPRLPPALLPPPSAAALLLLGRFDSLPHFKPGAAYQLSWGSRVFQNDLPDRRYGNPHPSPQINSFIYSLVYSFRRRHLAGSSALMLINYITSSTVWSCGWEMWL